ncbi:MAG: hypothetical protein U0T56_05690 [Ferruginibacter sp.]
MAFTPGSAIDRYARKSKKAPEGLLTSNNMFVFRSFSRLGGKSFSLYDRFLLRWFAALSDVKMPNWGCISGYLDQWLLFFVDEMHKIIDQALARGKMSDVEFREGFFSRY